MPWRIRYRLALLTALTLACMVGIMWGAYGPSTGLPFETAFPYTSETTPALRGFLYQFDPLRVHTSTFYHLGYLLGEAFGFRGSYFPYQLLYALLWWSRGMLVFAILRRFLPDCPSLCFSGAALAVVHSSDGAMMLVEQMNQFGYMFWMLLAMYCFACAWDAKRWWAIGLTMLAAAGFSYMSLWSYESPIVLILTFPVILMMVRRDWLKPLRLIVWYAVPITYLVLTYQRYTHTRGHSYQESVMRKSWGIAAIAADWTRDIKESLQFWNWGSVLGWRTPPGYAYALAFVAVLVFAAGWIAVIRLGGDDERPNPFAVNIRSCLAMLAAGFAALALSFPVYLLLDSAQGQWRTQFLSGIGVGIVFAALLGLISWVPLPRHARMALVITAGAVIAWCGCTFAIEKGGVHLYDWDRHRRALLEIAHFAPNVQPDTVIVLTNVPKDEDPFFHNMWFDFGLRLMYPGVNVAGAYFYPDGTPGPGNDLVLEGASWSWPGTGFGRLIKTSPLARTIVVEYHPSGQGKLLETLPPFLCKSTCATDQYHPSAAALPGPMSPIAARRFNSSRP